MKFISEGLILSDAAMTVSKACSTKTTTPVLECIKISAQNDAVTLIAYDGEISIEKKIKADVLEEGEICVNGRFFSDFMGKVSGMNVVISTGEKGLEIRYGDSESFLQVLSAEEFPLIKAEAGDDYFEVKESSLKSLIAKTVFCCATDESRPILKGCLLETEGSKLHATALDGYRMAVSECEAKTGKGNVKLVCPARTLTEISRMLENGEETLKIYVAKNMLFVSVNDTVLTSRLYTGEFVNKSNIFPSAFTTEVYVSRAELIESVERASILIRGDKNNLIILDIKGGNILITANSEIGNVAESVKVEMSGKELKIAMNGKFVLDALKALSEETVKLSFNNAISPFTLENKGSKEDAYLILPVRTGA
ncbi:MAG: DNA polymerase III subunit beta [Christensenellaceae bacterium]|jgi:DNA polymerase III, beta subunit